MGVGDVVKRLVLDGDVKGLTDALTTGERATDAKVKAIAGAIGAASVAIGGFGVAAGQSWDTATKTIVEGTGATGEALVGLQEDFQAVAKYGPDAATAIADLNTHTGRTGPLLQQLAEKALQANIDTATLGGTIKAFNLEGAEQEAVIDKIIVAGQAYGANINSLQTDIGRYKSDLDELGLSMDEQIALAAIAQQENARLRTVVRDLEKGVGGWREKMREAVPVIQDSADATESAYEAGKTWRDTVSEIKNEVVAYLGPSGDMLAGVGSLGTGLSTVLPLLQKSALAQKALNLVMTANPIGLIVTAIGLAVGAYITWKDEIHGGFRKAWDWFMGVLNKGLELIKPLTSSIGRLAKIIMIGESPGLVPALELADQRIETINGSLGTHKTRIEDVLTPVQDVTLAYGFFADELGTATPMAIGEVNTALLSAPRTAEQVRDDLRELAPTWGQSLVDGLGETFNPEAVGNTLARAFEGGGGLMGAIKSLASQAGGTLMSHIAGALSNAGPWGKLAAAAIPLAAALGRKIWGAITGMFGGGTNEAEDAYQSLVDVEGDEEVERHRTQALEDGLDERAAAVRGFIIRVRTEQGLSWAEADAEFLRFHAAQADSASKTEKAWAVSYAQRLQEDFIAMQATSDNAEASAEATAESAEASAEAATEGSKASAEAWAESYSASAASSTEATDEMIANSERIREAMVGHAQEIRAAWKAVRVGMIELSQLMQTLDFTPPAVPALPTGGGLPIVIDNRVEISARETTRAVIENIGRESRRRVGG